MSPPWGWDTAVFDEHRIHRYTLARDLALYPIFDVASRRCLFIMLNPSTADETTDDPTIRRCMGFAQSWGYDRIGVANLFSYRSTKPENLKLVENPEGDPENATTVVQLAKGAHLVVCAWGARGELYGRADFMTRILVEEGIALHHLGLTKDGQPRHPLYLKGETKPTRWTPGESADGVSGCRPRRVDGTGRAMTARPRHGRPPRKFERFCSTFSTFLVRTPCIVVRTRYVLSCRRRDRRQKRTRENMIAIIDTDGMSNVVWGLGETEAAARRDAASQEGYEATEWESVCELTDEQAERVNNGVVDVGTLGGWGAIRVLSGSGAGRMGR